MTKEFDNTNRFSLFVNDKKTSDKQPDRTGTLNVDGAEYFMDGWIKQSKKGATFLAGTIKRKTNSSKENTQRRESRFDPDEDIPF